MKNIFLIPTDTCYGIACPIGDADAYQRIYDIKKRDSSKPLAILIADLDWLYENTSLTEAQLNLISEYERPYTILTDCPRISMILAFEDENDEIVYPNHQVYKKIAFRVAHNQIQQELIKNEGPLFLTSANYSGEDDIYSINALKNKFEAYEKEIEILGDQDLDPSIKPSDLLEFVGETLELKYHRKN